MGKGYIIFTINGEVHFIKYNSRVLSSTECSYRVRGLRKLPTIRILDSLFNNIINSVYYGRLVVSDVHSEENVRELFENPNNLVELVRKLPGAFTFRQNVRRAWIL